MSSRLLFGVLFVLPGVFAGCKSDRSAEAASTSATPATPSRSAAPAASPSAAASPTTVTITASDYKLDVPAQIPAGVVNLRLVNHGKELHQAQIIRLEDGKTVDDFVHAVKQGGPPPRWVKFAGGPNGVGPGQEANAMTSLPAGHYVAFCIIPSPDGTPHLMKGMVQPFEVTGASSASVNAFPTADVTARLADYSFQLLQPLTPGRHTISVENVGPQPHELVLLKLSPGKSVQDFGKWAETGMKGPPPAMPLGGVAVIDQGGRGTFTVELTPGEYGLICFVPDAKDGKAHHALGMIKQVRVG